MLSEDLFELLYNIAENNDHNKRAAPISLVMAFKEVLVIKYNGIVFALTSAKVKKCLITAQTTEKEKQSFFPLSSNV